MKIWKKYSVWFILVVLIACILVAMVLSMDIQTSDTFATCYGLIFNLSCFISIYFPINLLGVLFVLRFMRRSEICLRYVDIFDYVWHYICLIMFWSMIYNLIFTGSAVWVAERCHEVLSWELFYKLIKLMIGGWIGWCVCGIGFMLVCTVSKNYATAFIVYLIFWWGLRICMRAIPETSKLYQCFLVSVMYFLDNYKNIFSWLCIVLGYIGFSALMVLLIYRNMRKKDY